MKLYSIPDLAGDGVVRSLAALMTLKGLTVPSPPEALWIALDAVNQGATAIRVGDASVSLSSGVVLSSQSATLLPPLGEGLRYRLDEVFVLVPSGDTLSVSYFAR